MAMMKSMVVFKKNKTIWMETKVIKTVEDSERFEDFLEAFEN